MREIILSISLVAVLTALFRLLVPNNSFKKQIGFLVVCFFLVTAASFIKTGALDAAEFDTIFTAGEYVDYSQQELAATREAVSGALSDDIRRLLEEKLIYPDEISVNVDISETMCISINEIRLVFSAGNADKTSEAEELVVGKVGDETAVVCEIIGVKREE